MNTPIPRTDIEQYFHCCGVTVIELGRIRDAQGTHAALLLPDEARVGRAWVRQAGLASGRLFSPGGGTGRSFLLDPDSSAITLSLFPADLGEHLLTRAERLDATDRFRIAAYLKAYFGSLARVLGRDGGDGQSSALSGIAQAAGHDVSILDDRAALAAHLADVGWAPTRDMLERLGIADQWIRDNLLPTIAPRHRFPPGVAVYFLRQRAAMLGFTDTARTAIRASGFEILAETPLTPDTSEILRRSTRGGNWQKGPFPTSGGPPAHLFFALDIFAHPPDAGSRARHPLLDNGRTLACKERIRDAILDNLPAEQKFNPVHSTDTSDEAAMIAEKVLDHAVVQRIAEAVAERSAQIVQRSGSGAAVAPGGDSFIYLRSGSRLRKLYRPHLADRAGDVLALHHALAGDGAVLPPVLDGSTETGHVDFADPGAEFGRFAVGSTLLNRTAAQRLRRFVNEAQAAGWHLDDASVFDTLWLSADGAEILLPGVEGTRGDARIPHDTSDARWRVAVGMPRSVFLRGGPLQHSLWRHVIQPTVRAMTRLRRLALRVLARLRRRRSRSR